MYIQAQTQEAKLFGVFYPGGEKFLVSLAFKNQFMVWELLPLSLSSSSSWQSSHIKKLFFPRSALISRKLMCQRLCSTSGNFPVASLFSSAVVRPKFLCRKENETPQLVLVKPPKREFRIASSFPPCRLLCLSPHLKARLVCLAFCETKKSN